jgi:cyanate permease
MFCIFLYDIFKCIFSLISLNNCVGWQNEMYIWKLLTPVSLPNSSHQILRKTLKERQDKKEDNVCFFSTEKLLPLWCTAVFLQLSSHRFFVITSFIAFNLAPRK